MGGCQIRWGRGVRSDGEGGIRWGRGYDHMGVGDQMGEGASDQMGRGSDQTAGGVSRLNLILSVKTESPLKLFLFQKSKKLNFSAHLLSLGGGPFFT